PASVPAPTRAQGRAGQSASQPPAVQPKAPFRFLPLNDRIAMPEHVIRKAWDAGRLHDLPLAEGLSGRLEISITFDGPMLIGEPDPSDSATSLPVKVGQEPVIPGATLRGLARATLEAAAFARLSQTNLHRRFGIRDFNHELFTDDARKAVRAGWLRPAEPRDGADNAYIIEPCYWYRVRIRDLKGATSDSATWHLDWLGKKLSERYTGFDMKKGAIFDFSTSMTFGLPAGEGNGQLVVPTAGGAPGILIFSDKVPAISPEGLSSPERQELRKADDARKRALHIKALESQNTHPAAGNSKRTEAVFAACGSGTPLAVPSAVWDTFIANNSRPSRHAPKPIGNWAILRPTLDAGGRIPVFWVADEGGQVVDFGLVRVFKRAHTSRVMDALATTGNGVHRVDVDAPDFCPDFVEALFGHVHEPEDANLSGAGQHLRRHLKSRVAFGFARMSPGCRARETGKIRTVQAAPKPSYAPFYLAKAGRKDWSEPGVELAGRKVYPPRNADADAIQRNLEKFKDAAGGRDNDTSTSLRLLMPDTPGQKLVFTAEIRVHNVTPAELGGLLWVLTFGGDPQLRHMIGRAKTAGAGQAQITLGNLEVTSIRGEPTDCTALIAAFTSHMEREVQGWATSAPIKALLRAANPATWSSADFDYMSLKEHQKLRQDAYDGKGPARFLEVPQR
ncbi:MAG: hypothetical protein JJT81_18060, partial [Rubellimicrobium sp.]|nr:hypothetical protein [Rubellimicrobium sp.]